MNNMLTWNQLIRSCRGWLYRRLPSWNTKMHRRRLAGYSRRWGLEREGFSKEGFFRVFDQRFLRGIRPGRVYELAVGDGFVGSLGVWFEGLGGGWKVEAWEHRPFPFSLIQKQRPKVLIHGGRLTIWSPMERKKDLVGIATRKAREASGVCREIRTCQIRPQWVGLWNPTMRPVWFQRMRSEGYQLEVVYQRMEFYLDKKR